MMIEYRTPDCIECGKHSVLLVEDYRLAAWRGGMLIQKAFPHLTAEVREEMMTGFHAACWDALFGEEEEEEWID